MFVVHQGVSRPLGGTLDNGVLCGSARARARSALHDCIMSFCGNETLATKQTTELEACATAYSNHEYSQYIGIMSKIIYNLRKNGDYILSKYNISQICRLTHKRLRADTEHAQKDAAVYARLQTLFQRAEAESIKATTLASSVHNATLIRCAKCKSSDNITRVLAQLRSGDEGMSTRCLCKCGNTWKLAS
jgi:DNA-directed RNA polymerase subunit M/transcription elongation factor TFIIS